MDKGGDLGRRPGTEDFKRRKSPVKGGLRTAFTKPIEISNIYSALNNSESLDNNSNLIMIKIDLYNGKKTTSVNTMLDSGATGEFINMGFCVNNHLLLRKLPKVKEVYTINGTASKTGRITYETTVKMEVGNHSEAMTFNVMNLVKHEAILGVPWLRRHNLMID